LIFENRIAHEWWTSEETAEYLGISENALRIMVHRNQIPCFRFGRRLRFRMEDCRALCVKKGP
jgi:excisionase family DNA binding protein